MEPWLLHHTEVEERHFTWKAGREYCEWPGSVILVLISAELYMCYRARRRIQVQMTSEAGFGPNVAFHGLFHACTNGWLKRVLTMNRKPRVQTQLALVSSIWLERRRARNIPRSWKRQREMRPTAEKFNDQEKGKIPKREKEIINHLWSH